MGAYAGAARRRVHLATVLPQPPSGHRPGRRQAWAMKKDLKRLKKTILEPVPSGFIIGFINRSPP